MLPSERGVSAHYTPVTTRELQVELGADIPIVHRTPVSVVVRIVHHILGSFLPRGSSEVE